MPCTIDAVIKNIYSDPFSPTNQKFSGGTAAVRYFILDHLGSITVVMNESGAVAERNAYDAWGKRRVATTWADDTTCSLTSATTRGFTGHEQIDAMCLINMNARIYDPTLGRFMTADPMTEDIYLLQVLNRYSYVGNNPLSLTDPSGMCFLGCFWNQSWFAAVVGVAVIIVAPYLEGYTLSGLFAEAANGSLSAIGVLAANGAIAGGLSAGISGGNVLKGALLGGLGAGLAAGIGAPLGSTLADLLGSSTIGNFIAQGFVGGINSSIGGGDFGSGFLAGGVGSLAGPLSGGQFDTGKMILSAALGGAASVLGGGKFENGAITGAFAYAATANYDASADPHSKGLASGDTCGSANSAACTHFNPSTRRAETEYYDSYYKLDPVSKGAVDAHEWIHRHDMDNTNLHGK